MFGHLTIVPPVFNKHYQEKFYTKDYNGTPRNFFSTPFHVITPILGINIIPKAINVIDAESIGCNIFQ